MASPLEVGKLEGRAEETSKPCALTTKTKGSYTINVIQKQGDGSVIKILTGVSRVRERSILNCLVLHIFHPLERLIFAQRSEESFSKLRGESFDGNVSIAREDEIVPAERKDTIPGDGISIEQRELVGETSGARLIQLSKSVIANSLGMSTYSNARAS